MSKDVFDDIPPIYPKEKPPGIFASIAYFIRKCAGNEEGINSLVMTALALFGMLCITTCGVTYHMNAPERLAIRAEKIEALVDKEVNPALAQCIVDENYGSSCNALREKFLSQ